MYGKHVHTYMEYTDSVEWEKRTGVIGKDHQGFGRRTDGGSQWLTPNGDGPAAG